MVESNPTSGQFLTTTPIIYNNGNHATGFFFRHEDQTYLVTNRHVLDFETENGDKLQSIKIRIRDNPKNLDSHTEYNIPLVDGDDEPYWLGGSPRLDLALMPLSPPILDRKIDILPPNQALNGKYEYGNLAFESKHFPARRPMSMIVSGGSSATLIGYPMMYWDRSYPITRNAIIASPYGRTLEELTGTTARIPKDAFLTDAVAHNGLSGSPVISTPAGSIMQNPDYPNTVFKAATLMSYHNTMSLLGVHKGEFDKHSELQLNATVYSSAITDILENSKTDSAQKS